MQKKLFFTVAVVFVGFPYFVTRILPPLTNSLHSNNNPAKLWNLHEKKFMWRGLLAKSEAVISRKRQIQQEMVNFNYSCVNNQTNQLEDLLLEKGHQPIRNVIVTIYRSGSTFLGAALASHPATFYHYEPLLPLGMEQIRSQGKISEDGFHIINNVLNCSYSEILKYMAYLTKDPWSLELNEKLWQYCNDTDTKLFCQDPKFLSDICKKHPFQLLKTTRLRLKLSKLLLKNEIFNVRLLLLVRDPRGTIQSRRHRKFCYTDADCSDIGSLCGDLYDDFTEAKFLRNEYPDRFLAMRYEDISMNPYAALEKITKFFDIQYHSNIIKFLDKHTKYHSGDGAVSLFRDSKTTPFHWKSDFVGNFSIVEEIQEKCKEAMESWGYVPVGQPENLVRFNSLKNPPWSEMIVEDIKYS